MTHAQKRSVLWAWLFLLTGFLKNILVGVEKDKMSLCAEGKGSRR